MSNNMNVLDEMGWQILDELQKNARITYKQLAEKVNLSVSPLIERIKRMEDNGIITGYRATINPKKVGYNISALLYFSSNYNNPDPVLFKIFERIPEIVSCWSITGTNDYLLEIIVPSLEFLESMLVELSKHGKITTSIVLPSSVKKTFIHKPREEFSILDALDGK